MKLNLKNFLTFMLLFIVSVAFAQEIPDAETAASFSAVKSFFLPAIISGALVLWADASKHIRGGTWDTGVFFKTKIKPFLLTTVLGIVLYFVLIYVPMTKPFIEALADSDLAEFTSAGLFGLATSIVDGLLKKPSDTEG